MTWLMIVLVSVLCYLFYKTIKKPITDYKSVTIYKSYYNNIYLVDSSIATIFINQDDVYVYSSITYNQCNGDYSNAFKIYRDGTFILRCVPTKANIRRQLPVKIKLHIDRTFNNAIDLLNYLYIDLKEIDIG